MLDKTNDHSIHSLHILATTTILKERTTGLLLNQAPFTQPLTELLERR